MHVRIEVQVNGDGRRRCHNHRAEVTTECERRCDFVRSSFEHQDAIRMPGKGPEKVVRSLSAGEPEPQLSIIPGIRRSPDAAPQRSSTLAEIRHLPCQATCADDENTAADF
jgi:hypothetical protein